MLSQRAHMTCRPPMVENKSGMSPNCCAQRLEQQVRPVKCARIGLTGRVRSRYHPCQKRWCILSNVFVSLHEDRAVQCTLPTSSDLVSEACPVTTACG